MSLILSPRSLPPGWRFLNEGELVQSLDQYLHHEKGRWVMSSFFTSDRFVNRGRSNYRRPMTIRAQIGVWPEYIGKAFRKLKAAITKAR